MAESASVPIVEVLTGDQRAALEALGSTVTYPSEQAIFLEGQPAHSVLIIQRGSVKATKRAADGTEVILAIRGVGEILGDEGVLMDEKRSATMTTITEVVGVDVRAEDLLRFVDQHKLWPVMYRAVVHRRRQSDQRILLARLDVKSRLARFLLELAADIGKPVKDGWLIDSALSQQDLATRINASRDAVAAELRKFRKLGLVTTGRRTIVLHDLDKIREMSN
jgi:CRP/FNR family transcriptional regulator, cyclic AMP receptor protein